MPDIILVDDPSWHSVPVSCLHSNIQKVLKDIWKHDSIHVMFKSELSRVTLCLHTRGYKCALLYFE
jgi:hypothetical protein